MDEDASILASMSLDVAPDEMVTHMIMVAIITRPGSWDDDVRITATPHTSRIMAFGALSDAIEQVRQPGMYGVDLDEEDEDDE